MFKKFEKNYYVILIILLFLFSISNVVVATDIIDNEEINISSNEFVLEKTDLTSVNEKSLISGDESNGSFTDLNNLINNNKVIDLNTNYTYKNNSDETLKHGIVINHSLTIDGNYHTIDGSGFAHVFNYRG